MLLRESSTRHAHPRWGPPLADTDAAIVPVPAGAPRARLQNGTDALVSMRNCIHPEVRFRALLTLDEIQKLEVVRA